MEAKKIHITTNAQLFQFNEFFNALRQDQPELYWMCQGRIDNFYHTFGHHLSRLFAEISDLQTEFMVLEPIVKNGVPVKNKEGQELKRIRYTAPQQALPKTNWGQRNMPKIFKRPSLPPMEKPKPVFQAGKDEREYYKRQDEIMTRPLGKIQVIPKEQLNSIPPHKLVLAK